MSGSDDLVCVYNATNAAMAELVRNLLQDEGIEAAVADTNHPFPGLPIAPSEVFVKRSSEVQARAVIAAAEQAHRDAAGDTENDLDDDAVGDDEDVADK